MFADRGELEPDKDMANVESSCRRRRSTIPGRSPAASPTTPCSNLAIGPAPQVIWTANVGKGSTSIRILTTPPVIADGKVFTKDAESTVSAFDADTGKVLWSVTLKPEKARDGDEFGGGLA